MIYEEGSIHMDKHIFDQWSVSHCVWGFALGFACSAPRSVAAWKIGLLFVFWELWENVIEVAFSTYAPGQYEGDSLVNSVFDMIPSMTDVALGRHAPYLWPIFVIAEAWSTNLGFGIHSIFLGHQGSICDIRTDLYGCGQAYLLRLVAFPLVFCTIEAKLWRLYAKSRALKEDAAGRSSPESTRSSPVPARFKDTLRGTPEKPGAKQPELNPSQFKL